MRRSRRSAACPRAGWARSATASRSFRPGRCSGFALRCSQASHRRTTSLARPATVLVEVPARLLLGVAVLLARDADAVQDVEQQDRGARRREEDEPLEPDE